MMPPWRLLDASAWASPFNYRATGSGAQAGHRKASHSILMGFDLGISGFMSDNTMLDSDNNTDTGPDGMTGGWSVANGVANALNWSGQLSQTDGNNQRDALRNFLSLYQMTMSDEDPENNNGSWEEIVIVNGGTPEEKDRIRTALFGGGTQATSAIQHVFVGDGPTNQGQTPADNNSFPRIRNVLFALGLITVRPSDRHENHFHIDFRTPRREPIKPATANLLASAPATGVNPAVVPLSDADMEDFLIQMQAEFNLTRGEMTMFTLDMPNEAPSPPMVIVAQASTTQVERDGKMRAMGVCAVATSNPDTPRYSAEALGPGYVAESYFFFYENGKKFGKGYDKEGNRIDAPSISIKVIAPPKHGEFVESPNGHQYMYAPDVGYVGNDKVIFEVMVEGQPVRVVYVIKVRENFYHSQGQFDKYCKVARWKISLFPSQTPDDLTTLLSTAASAFVGFADLPGSAVAQTTGYYNSGQITLDTNAAGWGWYIDPTPLDNTDDYLPTADPNIWKAKPNTEAEGRMDMLSVLLHEYGHVLGLEHSNDPRDFMATTLQPGERRLPSNAELQLMADLIAEVKGEMNLVASSTPAQPNNNPFNNPLPAAVVLPAFIVPRQNRYLGVVNPTLLNGNFGTGDTGGWETYGEVTVSDNKAILTESPTAQTRLTQAFMLGEDDRALSFTISEQNLIANRSGPGDAFEVALLDANTGLPVAGIIDLSRSDALLNIQTDGTEHMAQGMKKIINADGSATYIIALPEALTDTPVLLSFDLLGFGFGANSAESSVTLANIGPGDGEGLYPTLPTTALPARYRLDLRWKMRLPWLREQGNRMKVMSSRAIERGRNRKLRR